ncbi:hypothetical protein FQ087_10785 [Sporosarcina sp. ANT_H38]|uniref:hypothetical protein n=1 Tax=Sporosarcina sp. ANT_H38 TaxID=2597358 RepID=UPI0011F3DBDD|nr:hypothetical protein [Sporosarcina sp. ANT_H38]KAA0966683.1 hypothetical protein FQ087_10785 [Sporosarcina sp. ANT_H38]
MKSRWNLLYAAIATTLLLTACGTSPDEDTESNNGSTEVVENVEKDTVTGDKETDTEVDTNQENNLQNAELTESDEQGYAISVLPDYTLTSEEPGKDSLIPVNNESVFMRIETVTKENGTYDHLADNMIAVLEASGDGSAPIEVIDEKSIPIAEGIENAKALTIKAESSSITGIIFERDNMVVRLTIYDTPEEEYFEQFLRMSETIVAR